MSRNQLSDLRTYPRPTGPSRGKNGIAGFTMLEILISLVIVLLGVLGLAALIIRSNQAEMESYQRVQALMLAQDMADRINANRKVITCYSNGATGMQLGTGYSGTPACAAGNTQQNARAVADMTAWNSLLTGSAEVLSGSNVGAMIGARGCVDQIDPATQTYIVSVAWQGLAATAAPGNTCGLNLYGTDSLRRVVSVTLRIGTLL
ncbi:MAG: type IV pilus modification protein PilV [Pseudomonadota bacterium]